MSTYSGVFSETELFNLRVAADQIRADERVKLQYMPQVEALKALFDRQTNQLGKIGFNSKEKQFAVDVWWTNVCQLESRECTPCSVGGNEASTNLETKYLDYCREVPFSINENDFIDNEANFAPTLAKIIMSAKRTLSEEFAQYAIGMLNTFAGTNLLTTGIGNVSGNNTYIPATAWTANAISYMLRVIQMNRFAGAWLLSGANLHQAYLNATLGLKPEDNGNAWNAIQMVFDEYNVDMANSPDLVTYLISQGSYAIGNKAWSKPNEVKDVDGNMTRMLEKDEILPLEYDLFMKKTCSEDFTLWDGKLKLQAGIWSNPTGCDSGNTGVLKFECGEEPA